MLSLDRQPAEAGLILLNQVRPGRVHHGAHDRETLMKKRPAFIAASILVAAGLAWAVPPELGSTLTGEVLETQNVAAYTYLRLRTKDGEIWAAVPTTPVAKGAKVTLADVSMMQNFESKTLKRTFDRIVFASLVDSASTGAASTPANPHGVGAAPANPHGARNAAPAPVGKITKASGSDAKTVAETVAGATSLKDKPVTIRGQVVKYSPSILGKNWIHLQDGSGSADRGTHDILVTTAEKAAVGDVLDVRGTVRTNVDLGSGYKYAVLVEDAKLRK
jgi:hypothetical protein